MGICDAHKARSLGTKMFAIRSTLIYISAAMAAITVPAWDSASLGQVIAQSTESEERPPRDLGEGWEQLGSVPLIYCGALLTIIVLLLVAQFFHGNLMASEEEQRTRDEWYGTRNDDNGWWWG